MRRRAPTLLAAVIVPVFACTPAGPIARAAAHPEDSPSATVPAPTPATPAADRSLEARLLEVSNLARTAEGLSALVGRPQLDRVAAEHAAELAERRVLDHFSIRWGKRTLAERLDREYTLRFAAENLASVWAEEPLVARRAIALWLRSDGHRVNLLNARYTHSGIGIVRGEDGFWYVVQLYAVYH